MTTGSRPGLAADPSLPLDAAVARAGDWIDALHAAGEFNGSVLIAHDGHILLERHCGYADIEKRTALTEHSSFSIASVSKPFTALAILLLAHRGRLTLDDTLARHVPEFRDYSRITVRHLLHHTSGIPDYMDLADEVWDRQRLLTMVDLISLFQRYRPRSYFAPGDEFEYSNTGYALLGEIAARAAGMSYPELMAREIFAPLGMTDSAAFNLASSSCPLHERVYGFRRAAGGVSRCDLNFLDGVYGDGGIYASARDLLRWDSGLRDGTLLPPDVYAQAYVSGRLNNGKPVGYGFGWEIEDDDSVEHWGEWEGFCAYVRRGLTDRTLLAMLSNLGPPQRVDPICKELTGLVRRLDWPGTGPQV